MEKKKASLILGSIIAVVVLVFVVVLTTTGNKAPVYSIDNGTFKISSMYGQEISLSDVSSVQLKTNLPANLSRTNGYGFGSILKGKCSSDLGNVTVYVDTSKPPFIYLTTSSGLIILNDQSADKTQALYDTLNSSVKPS